MGLVALIVFTNGYTAFPYRGGILLCSVLTAVVIAAVVHPASTFARFWSLAPLVWIGKRSYGMYLWHFPILLLMTDPNATEAAPLWWNAVQFALIVAVSAVSFTFVENPVRKGKLGEWLREASRNTGHVPQYVAHHAVPTVACCVICAVALVGSLAIPPSSAVENATEVDAEAAAEQALQDAERAAAQQTVYDVLMIGDSVAARCENSFPEFFPNGYLDAAVGRPMTQGQDTYNRYSDLGVVGNDVVIALGTNNLVTPDQVESFIADIGPDKRIWLVNTRSDREWMDATNEALAQAAESHENVELIDWCSYSSGNDALLAGDATHLTREAASVYLAFIKSTIEGTE